MFDLISNVLTPNGDGKNDTWYVDGIERFPDSKVVIFDQYGTTVYESESYMNDWEATNNGSKLPNGTYFYILTFKNFPDFIYKGTITVLTD